MIAKRAETITSFIVMDVLEKANEMERNGVDVIHLEVGEPDFETPACIKTAAEKALGRAIFGFPMPIPWITSGRAWTGSKPS